MPAPEDVKNHTEDNDTTPDESRPIHSLQGNCRCGWPEREEHGDDRVDQGTDIDNRSQNWTHLPRAPMDIVFDRVVSKTLV